MMAKEAKRGNVATGRDDVTAAYTDFEPKGCTWCVWAHMGFGEAWMAGSACSRSAAIAQCHRYIPVVSAMVDAGRAALEQEAGTDG